VNRERESSKRPGEEGQGANEVDAPVIDEPAAEEGFREPEGSPPGESGETTQAPAPLGQALAEMRERWLRAEAEIQNVRRRAAREREEQRRELEDAWLLELAALDDDVARARQIAKDAGAPDSWTRGVELVSQRIRELLARHGVTPIDAQGKAFDPALHEALAELPAPPGTAPGTVLQVVTGGYSRNGRALRAARVVVARSDDEA
jgi:molecular chaperone GrpE